MLHGTGLRSRPYLGAAGAAMLRPYKCRYEGWSFSWRRYASSNGGSDFRFVDVDLRGSNSSGGRNAAAGAFADAEQNAGGLYLWRVLVERAARRRRCAAAYHGRP